MIERHLPYFVVVAEEQHFQRAADKLGLSQSALSRRIHLLEEELGFQLFERLPRGVKLSPAGESFYHDVRIFREGLTQARARAQSIVKGAGGRITIAINPSAVSNPVITRMFHIFRKLNSELQIDLKVTYSERQLDDLRRERIDVGAVYQFDREPWATYLDVCRDQMVLAMPRDHPLASKSTLSARDLQDTPLIWPRRSDSPRLYDHMIAQWNARTVSPTIAIEVQSTESVLSIVEMGIACGYITINQVQQAPSNVIVRRVTDLDISLPLALVWRGGYNSPALAGLRGALQMALDEMPLHDVS